MACGHKTTRNLHEQEPGQGNRYAYAAGSLKVAHGTPKRQPDGTYRVKPDIGEPFIIYVSGRNAWALNRLIVAGAAGVTPIAEPAGPRWSAYIFNLRKMGVPIETLTEIHDGQFPGKHGRYVLRAGVLQGGSV